MLKRYEIQDRHIVESENPDASILVYAAPDDAEKHALTEIWKIDEHTLSSALDPDELSRFEFEPDHMACIVKRPKNYSSKDQFLFRVTSLGLFLFQDRLIVVLPEEDQLFMGKAYASLRTPTDVMLRVIYNCIYHFLEHLRVINMVSEELELKINTSMENRFLINLFTLSKSLVYYLNAIHTNAVLINKLKASSGKIGITGTQLEYLDDIGVENEQCYKLAEIYSNVLSSMMDARVSVVNNNISVLMKRLNLITIAIMMPTLVVSAFSMNVVLPLPEGPFRFWIILGLALASAAGVLLVWRYKRLG